MNFSYLVLLLTVAGTHAGPTEHIVGGEDAAPHSWPWQLSLRYYNQHACGASLLSEWYAVTAAHCVDGADIGVLTIVAGAHGLYNTEASKQTVYLASYTMHPQYSSSTLGYPNDVAVLTFSSPLTLNDEVRPANLTDNENNFSGATNCYITGWGRTSGDGPLPEYLQQAHTTVISNFFCGLRLGLAGPGVGPYHVCVHTNINGGCNGDSGGPLVCPVGEDWILIGATSWGLSNCPVENPTVYTRLSSFRDWIRGITESL